MSYLHLFFDDANLVSPEIKLQTAKDNIYKSYNKFFLERDENVETDLEALINNKIGEELDKKIVITGNDNKEIAIDWENINLSNTTRIMNSDLKDIEKSNEILKGIEDIIDKLALVCNDNFPKGIVSKDIIDQIRKSKESLFALTANGGEGFITKSKEKGLNSAVYGTLRGAIVKAQGAMHELAVACAGYLALQKIENELVRTNQNIQVIIEQTGGTLREDSHIKKVANNNNLNLDKANNAKNDITIALTDSDGIIIWTYGLSLKSTTSSNPKLVHIVTTSVSTLLNKSYSPNDYVHFAGSLGIGDWVDSNTLDILARQKNITTSGASLAKQWKDILYNSIYEQIIDMFSGLGHSGILNNAQYMIINKKIIPMYEIFSKLEQRASQIKRSNDYSFPGLEISTKDAPNRSIYTQKNIAFFNNEFGEKTQRGERAWSEIHKILENKKIKISLKYAELGFGHNK